MRMVLSLLPETILWPSVQTEVTSLVWHKKGDPIACPVLQFHIRTVLSLLPDTSQHESGEKQREVTRLPCLPAFPTGSCDLLSHICTSPVLEAPEAINLPSGDTAIAEIVNVARIVDK